jgi:integrase
VPKLTKRLVNAQGAKKDRDRVLWDTELKRFGLRVRTSGMRTFIVQYRFQGRTRVMTLGRYPDLSVDAARTKAHRMIGAVGNDRDPAAERDKQRGAPTVRELAERWLEQHVRPKLKASTAGMSEWLLRKHVLPAFGRRVAKDVTRADIVRFHASMAATPYGANRALATLREVLGFGERTGVIPANPARGVPQYKEPARERYLSDAEIDRLGRALAKVEQEGAEEPHAVAAIRLLLLTGCRRGEILHARWSDVDAERGVLHLRDTKTGARDVPLNAPALAVLDALPRFGEWIVPRRVLTTPPRLDRVWRRVRSLAGLSDVRLHDLRHAFASIGVASGVPLYTVGGLLGHSLPATTARYAHLADDPLRRATELVGARIAASLEGKAAAKVVPLRDRA